MRDARGTARRVLAVGAAVLGLTGTVVGDTLDRVAAAAAMPPARAGARTPAPFLTVSPPADGQRVGITQPLVVTAVGGALTEVSVTGGDGRELSGTFSPDHTRWSSEPLTYATLYSLDVTGEGSAGRDMPPLHTSLRTAKPARLLRVEAVRPADGQVVGVAMPISIYFNHPVRDRAAVERRLSVTPSVPSEGSFNWVADDQVNWRPRHFWEPGTTVVVRTELRGVDAGSGTFGDADRQTGFTVGRHQEAVGDTRTHQLSLLEDGKVIKTMPASFGRSAYPTGYGMHVAFEKLLSTRMRSDAWGGPREGEPGFYDEVLPLAVRISANGEFVHVNGATVAVQGRQNVSHGCVNLSPANGRAFYDWVQIGDPVNIVGGSRPLVPTDGDIADWLTPWEQYRTGSALWRPELPALTAAEDVPRVTE